MLQRATLGRILDILSSSGGRVAPADWAAALPLCTWIDDQARANLGADVTASR
jgi:hypothetical protein